MNLTLALDMTTLSGKAPAAAKLPNAQNSAVSAEFASLLGGEEAPAEDADANALAGLAAIGGKVMPQQTGKDLPVAVAGTVEVAETEIETTVQAALLPQDGEVLPAGLAADRNAGGAANQVFAGQRPAALVADTLPPREPNFRTDRAALPVGEAASQSTASENAENISLPGRPIPAASAEKPAAVPSLVAPAPAAQPRELQAAEASQTRHTFRIDLSAEGEAQQRPAASTSASLAAQRGIANVGQIASTQPPEVQEQSIRQAMAASKAAASASTPQMAEAQAAAAATPVAAQSSRRERAEQLVQTASLETGETASTDRLHPSARNAPAAPVAPAAATAPSPAAPTAIIADAPQPVAAPTIERAVTAPQTAERHDFGAVVERLAAAREMAQPGRADMQMMHREFGNISVQFEMAGQSLKVAMTSGDAAFAPAVQAALAERPIMPVAEAGRGDAQMARQDGQSSSQQSQSQNQSQGQNQGQSGPQAQADGQRQDNNNRAPQTRQTNQQQAARQQADGEGNASSTARNAQGSGRFA